jgi:chitinase
VDALDFEKLNPILDAINIMTYDFTSGNWGDKTTGHHSRTLESTDPLESRKGLSTQYAAQIYVAKGADPKKINLGVAFYGRGFKIEP